MQGIDNEQPEHYINGSNTFLPGTYDIMILTYFVGRCMTTYPCIIHAKHNFCDERNASTIV